MLKKIRLSLPKPLLSNFKSFELFDNIMHQTTLTYFQNGYQPPPHPLRNRLLRDGGIE